MAPQRPSKPDSTPDPFAISGGGGVPVDKAYEIVQRLSTIEKSIAYLEGSADDTKKQLKEISEKISVAQGSFTTAKYFLGATCLAVWGLVAMWAKHHFGW